MSVESYIRALPKVDLHCRLEGAVPRETMLMFANQNEIGDEVKRFHKWLDLYKTPDYKRLDELADMLRSWLRYGDDLTRAVYDMGVAMSKDNVRYAEVGVNPLSYVANDFTFDEFLAALNDGRDRAERAWGVQMRWNMVLPRNTPRRADEIARWATSATARKGGVVGVVLAGYDDLTTLDQFERAFATASKKDITRNAYLSSKDDVDEAIDLLSLNQIVDVDKLVESPHTLTALASQGVSVSVGVARTKAYGWANDPKKSPISALQDAGLRVVVSTDMPVLFDSTLSDEYLKLVEAEVLSVDDVEEMIRTSIELSSLEDEDKEALAAIYEVERDVLHMEHMPAEEGEDTSA